ncbi:MAG: hypothetical protein RLW87_20895 [Alphaproteobacteria bacterium]
MIWPAHKRAVRKLVSAAGRETRATARAGMRLPGKHLALKDLRLLDLPLHRIMAEDRERLEEAIERLLRAFEAYCDLAGIPQDPVETPRYVDVIERALERERVGARERAGNRD